MDQPYHLQLRILSHPQYLCVVRAMMETALRRLGYDEPARTRVTLAVDEALANIIRHGYDGRADGPIWLQLSSMEQADGEADGAAGVRIVIEDEARQVDPATIRSRDLAQVKPGGLGVHVIREVMDEVHYSRRDGKGMRLVMVRHPRPAEPADAAADGSPPADDRGKDADE